MNLREFYRHYGLELIPVAMEDLTLGKCVWDGGWFSKPKFTHNNMPYYIFNAFEQTRIIGEGRAEKMLIDLRALPKVDAAFAHINIELEVEDALEIHVNELLKIKSEFDLKKVKSFNVSNSKGISIPNKMRMNIDQMLDELKENHWDDYKRGLRRAYMITELYYGTISISIDVDLENEIEASFFDGQSYSNKFKLGNTTTYEFSSQKVPLAMRLERIKHFNS